MDQPTDEDLMRAVERGDPAALMALHDRYARAAFALAYRVVGEAGAAEEAVQDAFLLVWRRASTFDGSQGKARAWVLTIVHHKAIDQLRARRRRGGVPLDLDGLDGVVPGLSVPDVWGQVALGLDQEQVRAAVAALPEDQRRAIELGYFDGLSQREIAERIGVPLGTVKGRVRLGLRRLQAMLVEPSHAPVERRHVTSPAAPAAPPAQRPAPSASTPNPRFAYSKDDGHGT